MRVSTRVKVDAGPLTALRGSARATVRAAIQEQADRTLKYAQEFAPQGKSEGRGGDKPLRDTLYRRVVTDSDRMEFWVGSTSVKALWVTKGTRPHLILPQRAKVLHFFVNGEEVFTRRVHHPGTKPDPFLDRAAERAQNEMLGRLVPILQHWAKGRGR